MKIISKFRIILPLIIAVPSVIIPTSMNYIVNKENDKINYDDVKKHFLFIEEKLHHSLSSNEINANDINDNDINDFGGISKKEFIDKALYFTDLFEKQKFTLNDINDYLNEMKLKYSDYNLSSNDSFSTINNVNLNRLIMPSELETSNSISNTGVEKSTYNLLKNLRIANAAVASISAALAIASASMYAFVVPSFGGTLPIAIGLSVASIAVGTASSMLILAIDIIDKERDDWERAISAGAATYKVGHVATNIAKVLYPIVNLGKFLRYVPLLGAFIETCGAILAIIDAIKY